jgi:hypothetical protein
MVCVECFRRGGQPRACESGQLASGGIAPYGIVNAVARSVRHGPDSGAADVSGVDLAPPTKAQGGYFGLSTHSTDHFHDLIFDTTTCDSMGENACLILRRFMCVVHIVSLMPEDSKQNVSNKT